jgi:hypothetical protein
MQKNVGLYKHIQADLDSYIEKALPPLHHQWPLLGQELFLLEQTLGESPEDNETDEERQERRKRIRNTVIAQMYREEGKYTRDTRFLAFLLLKKGRGGLIVGNPYVIREKGNRQELPYTGLEGYYAGSEQTAIRPGMSPAQIVLEEANIGAELLQTLKKRSIEHNSWIEFTHLQQALAGNNGEKEIVNTIQLYCAMIVRRLHVRIYHNPEFELTLTEQIEQGEQLVTEMWGKATAGKQGRNALQGTLDKLKHTYQELSEAEKELERQERRRREHIRAERIAEYKSFRDETYQILADSRQGRYTIDVQDTFLEQANITETIILPEISGRTTYPPTDVPMTAPQCEGYLFLARVVEMGGDPIARSVLVSS